MLLNLKGVVIGCDSQERSAPGPGDVRTRHDTEDSYGVTTAMSSEVSYRNSLG
jgi:hypothetical protein